eukprot:1280606-Rhodomonas_salina.1
MSTWKWIWPASRTTWYFFSPPLKSNEKEEKTTDATKFVVLLSEGIVAPQSEYAASKRCYEAFCTSFAVLSESVVVPGAAPAAPSLR